ncbi:lysine biosynthesis protein LysW [Micromonospora sp. WMMD882]|uniref:alpha-aminoadipate/glutamate carrier protein LysW n=1 Tax=Micromonospora sp. WMMD882 TaxID=3015151 RepID=UPI00248A971D|nr:alpha-aminoadipate/glutamate carrier protein LysW [Micromonospora sp. WMMD882]WBB77729.1 lysine biosynthesis protein LysW [Micromonospora sp. WMMD882]
MTTTTTAHACPECEGPIHVPDSARLSEILECGDCRSELEIVALGPAVLALAPEIEEDWGE